jgi:hypothetical protein
LSWWSGRRASSSAPGSKNFLVVKRCHDEQRLIGLINRMRLFAPNNVVNGAEAVLRAILEIALKPSIELRQLAKEALSKRLDPDPLLAFSEICRTDLDHVRRTGV